MFDAIPANNGIGSKPEGAADDQETSDLFHFPWRRALALDSRHAGNVSQSGGGARSDASRDRRRPKAVLMISGHWEGPDFAVMASPHPPMVVRLSRVSARNLQDRLSRAGAPNSRGARSRWFGARIYLPISTSTRVSTTAYSRRWRSCSRRPTYRRSRCRSKRDTIPPRTGRWGARSRRCATRAC